MERNVTVIRDIDGNKIVMINDIRFKGKRSVNWDDVKEYLKSYVGEFYTIAETEEVVYIGADLPDEYTGSRYTHKLMGTIAKAKANNMPNDTIERGIKKAAGEGASTTYFAITYEGYGPSGTAVIVETLTDNKNRTAANVRSAFTKGSGNVGTPGCVSFMFDKKGQILVSKESCKLSADDLMMTALDAGAEDFIDEDEDMYEILTDPDSCGSVREALEAAGVIADQAEVQMIPQTYVDLTDENDIKQMNRLLDLLDDDDDVQNVYHNWNMPEEDEED